MSGSSSAVLERERRFYNDSAGTYRRLRRVIWRSIGAFNRNHELRDLYDPQSKRVLLYGCGPANEAERLLGEGAVSVAGIDISDGEVDRARATAERQGLGDRVDFRVGDAHATGFEDGAFDLIVGSAIIHHLEVPRALAEIRRLLAPGGRAVFLEPLAHNPLLRLGRQLTPAARTADEHPLTTADWSSCATAFPGFWHREVELFSTVLMPINLLLPSRQQARLAPFVRTLDDRLLEHVPALRPYARTTFLVLE